MKLNPPNAHRSQIKICEKRQTRNVQFRFMPNAFRILKPIQKSSKCVWVFRNTGANTFAKNQTRLAYEDKRALYCSCLALIYMAFCHFRTMEPRQMYYSPYTSETLDIFIGHFKDNHHLDILKICCSKKGSWCKICISITKFVSIYYRDSHLHLVISFRENLLISKLQRLKN